MGLYLRDTILFHGQPFPAANGSTSASFQLDSAHNNHSANSIYLIESYHTQKVLLYFTTKLFACLPRTLYNLFGGIAYPGMPPTEREKAHLKNQGIVLQFVPGYKPTPDVIRSKLELVFSDFSEFIAQQKYQWSFQQSYTIESTYYLYYIHFSFMRSINSLEPLRLHPPIPEQDLTNPQVGLRIANLQPIVSILINLLQTFLQEIDDRKLYCPVDEFTANLNYTALLPYDLMSTVLETLVQMNIYLHQLGVNPLNTFEQIQSVHDLLKHSIFWIPQQKEITKKIDSKLMDFIRANQLPISKNDRSPYTDFGTVLTPAAEMMDMNGMSTNTTHLNAPLFYMGSNQLNLNTTPEMSPVDPITSATASMDLNADLINNNEHDPTRINNGHDPTLLQDIDDILNSFDSLY